MKYVGNFIRNSKFGYRRKKTVTNRKKVLTALCFIIWKKIRTKKQRDRGEWGRSTGKWR